MFLLNNSACKELILVQVMAWHLIGNMEGALMKIHLHNQYCVLIVVQFERSFVQFSTVWWVLWVVFASSVLVLYVTL